MSPFTKAKTKALASLDAARANPGNENLEAWAGFDVGNLADLLRNPDMFEDVPEDNREIATLITMVENLTEADADPDL